MSEEWRGELGGMTRERLDIFLAGSALARLACLKPDGSPYVMPVWYQWDGNAFWFVGRQRSVWCRYIQQDPRVSVVVDELSYRDEATGTRFENPKVYAEGEAEVVEEPNVGGDWVRIAEEMALRYLGPNGPSYLVPTLRQPRWLIKLAPRDVKTWEGVGWARRYWVEETGGPSYEEVHGG